MFFHLDYPTIALLVTLPLLVYFIVKWLFTKNTEVENRRRAAAMLASKLQEYGLKRIPQFLTDYAVGDYSGMVHEIHSLAELFLSGEGPVIAELEAVYNTVLDKKLATEEGKALIAAKLAAVTAPAAAKAA